MRIPILAVLLFWSAPASAQVFSPADVQFLADKEKGAQLKSQVFYYYFRKDRDPRLPFPAAPS